jgi:hypothetical protein
VVASVRVWLAGIMEGYVETEILVLKSEDIVRKNKYTRDCAFHAFMDQILTESNKNCGFSSKISHAAF